MSLAKLGLRSAHIVARREGVDGRGVEELACAVDDGHLDAGTDAWIKAHRGARARRGSEQQILEVAGEDVDCLFLGAFAQGGHEIDRRG